MNLEHRLTPAPGRASARAGIIRVQAINFTVIIIPSEPPPGGGSSESVKVCRRSGWNRAGPGPAGAGPASAGHPGRRRAVTDQASAMGSVAGIAGEVTESGRPWRFKFVA